MDVHDVPSAATRTEPFEAFYRRTYRRMRGLAYVMTGSNADLDELLQDAYAAIYSRYVSDILRDPDFYLRQTVVNMCRRWRRQQSVRRQRVDPSPFDADDLVSDRLLQCFDDDLGHRDAVWKALDTLSDDQRTACVLRYYEQLSFAEIADALSNAARPLTEATVRSWVHRALHHLVREVER